MFIYIYNIQYEKCTEEMGSEVGDACGVWKLRKERKRIVKY